MTAGGSDVTRHAIAAVLRIESPRLIAGLVRVVRDVGLAEDRALESLGHVEDTPGVSALRNTKAPPP